MTDELTPQQLAERTVAGMLETDAASRALGMTLAAVGPGHATVTMPVRDDMLNGFGICHGGLITALADSAFAFACNSYGELTVAAGLVVDFLAPARAGDVLTAQCTEVALTGRTGVYDAEVLKQDGTRIAVFRGRSYRVRPRPNGPPV